MRVIFVVAVVAVFLRGASPLREGTPNCPVMGSWSDAEGSKTLRLWRSVETNTSAPGNTTTPNPPALNVTRMELNVTDHRFVYENRNVSKPQTIYNSTAFLVVLANITGPAGYGNANQTIVELLCANDILYVDIYPPADIALQETSFSLRRLVAPTLSEAPQESPTPTNASPASSDRSPQFILVNITLPNRQDDDSQSAWKEGSQGDADAPCDASEEDGECNACDCDCAR